MTLHISKPSAPPGVEDSEADYCCDGAALRGAAHCTCWIPIFDTDQAEPAENLTRPEPRTKACHDCAFQNGSPEQDSGELDWIRESTDPFVCHQGMRRVVAYRHPDGRELPAGDGDYQPPIVNKGTIALCADGTPGALCAGWVAWANKLGIEVPN